MAITLSLFAGAGAQFFDDNGIPLAGGKIYTYAAGTTTPLATYTTASNSAFHTNPIILDAAGRIPAGGELWLEVGVGYKFVVKTSAEVLIATYDNIPSAAQPPAANDADSIMYEQGYTVTAGSFVVGKIYRIVSVGTTNFTLIGATSNTIGLHFIATGAGTGDGTAELSQTVEAKLRQYVSVKDFGAVGNGIVDDTAAIQAAVNSVPSLGGQIFFPQGSYLISSTIILPASKNITLLGEGTAHVNNGFYGSQIKKAASLNGNALEITTNGSIIEKLMIQGVAGNGGDGILIKASRITLRDVGVYAMGNDGIRIGEDTGGINCNLWYLDNVKSKNNGGHGVHISEGAGPLADTNAGTLLHADLQSNALSGLYLNGTQLNTIVGGAFQNNGEYGIHFTQYAEYNCIFGSDVEANTIAQIRIDNNSEYNAIYCYTLLYATMSISSTSQNNRIEVLDHNRIISGLTFPPTQIPSNNANTLDDYEEGTFTPVIAGATTAGTGTYVTQQGRYTKIGRTVTYTVNIEWSAHTGTGNTEIRGFPFSAVGGIYDVANIIQDAGPVPGADKIRVAFIQSGTTEVQIREYDFVTSNVTNSNAITATGVFYISGTYTTST